MRILRRLSVLLALAVMPTARLAADGLGGSPSSMVGQHEVAVESDYSFLRRPADVAHMVELGKLVSVNGNADYSLSKVSFPYARPEVLSFIEHLAMEYRENFGSKLVVTSLTRPGALQPRNAHALSVHPAGMAADFRIPADSTRRAWLEKRLLELEVAGAVDVTREKNPPHYHVAVFAGKYLPIAAREDSVRVVEKAREEAIARAEKAAADAAALAAPNSSSKAPLLLGALAVLFVGAPVVRRNRRRTDL